MGADPFGPELEPLTGKTVQDQPIEIRRLKNAEEAVQCQVVFIGDEENALIEAILEQIGTAPVLTVGEDPGFIRKGGMGGFQTVHRHVRFNANLDATEKAHLKVSSQLLKVANSIQGLPKENLE